MIANQRSSSRLDHVEDCSKPWKDALYDARRGLDR